jgi:hypothetical protein
MQIAGPAEVLLLFISNPFLDCFACLLPSCIIIHCTCISAYLTCCIIHSAYHGHTQRQSQTTILPRHTSKSLPTQYLIEVVAIRALKRSCPGCRSLLSRATRITKAPISSNKAARIWAPISLTSSSRSIQSIMKGPIIQSYKNRRIWKSPHSEMVLAHLQVYVTAREKMPLPKSLAGFGRSAKNQP